MPLGGTGDHGLGGDQRIQRVIRRDAIDERDDVPTAQDQPVSGGCVGYGGKLLRGDAQQMGQGVPGIGRLIEQDQQLRVGQHGLCPVALEHIVHVLSDTGVAGVVFPRPLPLGEQKLGAVFTHEQQVELVYEYIGEPLFGRVLQDAVVDGIQDHQHTHRFQGTAQVPDVITDQGVFRVHVGGLGEDVQQTLGVQLDLQGQVLRLLLVLLSKAPIEVLEGRSLSPGPAADVFGEHHGYDTGDNGLFLGGDGADHHLTEGGHEVRFLLAGVLGPGVLRAHVQGVYMVGGVGGYSDDLPMEGPNQGRILPFRVDDDHVTVAAGGQLEHFGLCEHRLAGTGDAQDQTVSVLKLPAVDEDQVAGDLIPAAVDPVGVLQALGSKGHERSCVLCGHGPKGVDSTQAVRQGGVHALPLPILQHFELAAVLSTSRDQRGGIAVQLLFAVCQMDQCHGHELQLLVLLGQLLEQVLRLLLLLLDVVGERGGPVQVLILFLRPLGGVGGDAQQDVVDLLHRFAGGDGDQVDGQHEVAAHVAHLPDHGILQDGGIVLEVQYPPVPLPDLDVVRLIGEERRRDHVQEGVAPAHEGLHIEMKVLLLPRMEEVVEHPQAFLGVQLHAFGIESVKPGLQVGGDGPIVLGNIVVPVMEGGHGGVNGMGDPIPHLGVRQKDVVPALDQRVQVVPRQRDQIVPYGPLGLSPIEDGDLGGRSRFLTVQQLPVGFDDLLLGVNRRHGVVDVRELEGLGILLLPDLEDAVIPYPLDGDGVLYGPRHLVGLPVPLLYGLQGLNQPSVPPYTWGSFSALRRTGCRAGRPGVWA